MSREIIILVLIMLISTKNLSFASILIQDENHNEVVTCLGQIFNQHAEAYTIIVSNVGTKMQDFFLVTNSKGFIIYTKNNFASSQKLWKLQMFIILIDDIKQMQTILQLLYATITWNSRAKFLIGYLGSEDIGDIFKISWTYYITNINVIAMNGSNAYVYTHFPYKNNRCGDYQDYDLITTCEQNNFQNVFPSKVPFDLQGCQIKVMPYKIPPYVINLEKPKESPGKAGIEVTIIHNVAKRMNISLIYLKNPHRHWGYRFADGNFSLMYKDLKERQIDIIFGFTYGNSSYSKDFDASFCHLSDSSVWFFPTAVQMAQWKNLTNIFEGRLWLAILMMLIVNGFAWWFIGRTREPADDFNDLTICIMSSLYVLLQGSVEGPTTWKLRLVFILWLITCLLIFTAHQCQLISILTSPLYERQMKTLEELIEIKSEFGFYPTIEDAYRGNNSLNKAILTRYQQCPLTEECLNRTAFKRDFAVVKNRRQVLYLMPRYYTFPNGRDMLFDTEIAAFTTRERYYTYKGFPLLDRFDNLLMLLAANGLISKWDADTRFFILKIESDPDHEPLSLGHLQGAFLVFTFGITFAILVFLCEVVKRKCCTKKAKKRKE